MNSLTELINPNLDTVFFKEVLKILTSFRKGCIKQIPNVFFRLFSILFIKFYLSNTEKTNSLFIEILKARIYTTRKVEKEDFSEDFYFNKELNQINGRSINGFPIYYESSESFAILRYIPFFHNKFIHSLIEKAKEHFKNYQENAKTRTICTDLDGVGFNPKTLFPSNNYLYLTKVIQNHFIANQTTNNLGNLSILLDGEPGLGKSDCCDFIAKAELCEIVLRIDFTEHLDKPFNSIVKKIKERKGKRMVVLFDELDKYIEFRLNDEYTKMKRTQKKNEKMLEFNEYYKMEKEKFLYEVLSILGMNFNQSAVLIFCSNNFTTLFDGVDLKHFESLWSRITKIHFERCATEELKNYLRYLNKLYLESPQGKVLSIPDEELEKHLLGLRNNILIPYRSICQLNVKACYEIKKFVDLINVWEEEKLPVSKSQEKIDEKASKKDDCKDKENEDNNEDSEKEKDEDEENEYKEINDQNDDEDDGKDEDSISKLIEERNLKEKEDNREIMENIKIKLAIHGNLIGVAEQADNAIQIFEYLNTDKAIRFLYRQSKFKQTLFDKMDEIIRTVPNNLKAKIEAIRKEILDKLEKLSEEYQKELR